MGVVEDIRSFTASKIQRILTNPSEGMTRASLAELRRGVGHVPGDIPELWGEYLLNLPENLMGNEKPSHAEWAIYIAMTMFALHQQGKDCKTNPMHRQGNSLGASARCLIESEDDRERVARRFNQVAVASDMEAMSHHLRSLVTLLRTKDIPLDYVRLASDLYLVQNPQYVNQIRLRWGEDFCRVVKDNDNEEQKGQ